MNMKQMSGNVTTPIVALAHYLWGNGAERSVNIANIGLKISPMKINQIKDIIKSGVVGTFPVSTKFTHATGDYNVITGAYLGNITLKTEGTLTISANGSGLTMALFVHMMINTILTPALTVASSESRSQGSGRCFLVKSTRYCFPGEIHIKESGKR